MKTYQIIISILAITSFVGCSGGGGSSVTGSSESPPAAELVQTDIRKIVSVGQNLSFNDQTGGANDTALHPTTKFPAVAYHDRNHAGNGSGATPALGALKYAYMDAQGTWNIEVVDVAFGAVACGTAGSFCIGAPNAANANQSGIIRLAFKSTGEPVIAYVYGASSTGPGTKEIRFAERSASGVWTTQTAFASTIGGGAGAVATANTVDPLKGLTLLLDSSNRPHVSFALYASTIASSQIKYAFRNSAGTWSNSNITTAVQGGAITGLAQGVLQAGSAMCSNTAGPVYSYQLVTGATGFGHPAFIRCSTYDANNGCTAWTTQDLVNECNSGASSCVTSFTFAADGAATGTNAGLRTDLTIEPTTNRPVIAIFSTATPATGIQALVAPNACDVAQPTTTGSWGATTVIDNAATTGQNGLRIHASSNTNFLLSYSFGAGATSALRVNRTTSGMGGWFTNGTVIEAQANLLANEGIGSVYDPASDLIFVSYAQLPGNTGVQIGNDIRLAYTDPDNLSSGGAAGSFVIDNIDNTGNGFPVPTAGTQPWMSAAKAPSGLIGYTYFYQDSGAAGDSKLYYGFRGGSSSSPVFSEKMVTNHMEGTTAAAAVGLGPSLTYDANSNPIIASYNGVTTEQNLIVARSGNGGTTFGISVVDDTSANIGLFPSVSRFGNAIGIAYRDETNTGLKFAKWTSSSHWQLYTVDGLAGAGACSTTTNSGQYAKLAFTSTGQAVVAFQDDTASPVTVRLAISNQVVTTSSLTWTCLNIDGQPGNTRGEGLDFVLDSSDRIHIVHYDATAGSIRYVNTSVAIGSAITAGTSAFTAGEVSAIGVSAILNANLKPSIQISSAGVVFISFPNLNSDALILGTKATAMGPASEFSLEVLDSNPSGSTSTTPTIGQGNALILNASDKPSILYRSLENWIRYFSRELL